MASRAETILSYYTVESKDKNSFVQYTQYIKLYKGRKGSNKYKFLPTQQYVYPIEGQNIVLPTLKQYGKVLSLRENQAKIIDTIRQRIEKFNYHAGLITMKTGGGKSFLIMQLTQMYEGKILILCHNQKTLLEMGEKFESQGITDYGLVYAKSKQFDRRITITTHDSFVSFADTENAFKPDVILYDECDFSMSKTMINALCETGAKAMYGFTGTPYRSDLDNNDMQKIFGKSLVDNTQYHFTPAIEVIKYMSGKRMAYENFAELKDQLIADFERAEEQVKKILELYAERKYVLVLTERIEEAGQYYTLLHNKKIDSLILISGNTNPKDDKIGIEKLRANGKGIIIGTVGKMSRGVDIPEIDTVCLFSALHFKGTVIQAVGRCMRTHPGKTNVKIIDWSDRPILYNQSVDRIRSYCSEYGIKKSEIKEIIIKSKRDDKGFKDSAIQEV